jgi:hypothetical protein
MFIIMNAVKPRIENYTVRLQLATVLLHAATSVGYRLLKAHVSSALRLSINFCEQHLLPYVNKVL